MFSASELINPQMPGSNGSNPGPGAAAPGGPLDPLNPDNPLTMVPSSDPTTWPKEDPGNSANAFDNANAAYQAYFDYMNSAREADYAYNHQEAALDREWQQYMSSTAYQRQVEDLKAAGLNPWMAVQNGSGGASSGSGAVASSNAAVNAMSAYGDYSASKYNTKWNNYFKLGNTAISALTSMYSTFGRLLGTAMGSISYLGSSALRIAAGSF